MSIEEEQWSNVLTNAAMPVDFRKTTQVGGAMGYVGVETIISYIARRVFKVAPRGILELMAIHSFSLPFIGGLSVFADKEDHQGLQAPWPQQFIPAVFASTYLVNTYLAGLHLPKLDFKDILITAATKIASRPVMSLLYPNLGDSFRNGQDALSRNFALQRQNARFGSD
mgnify:FL=1